MWKNKRAIYKTDKQIQNIRDSGKYLNELLKLIRSSIQPGIPLQKLENIAQDFMDKHNLKWAFNGYQGFPANLCLSINDCIVHGIPDDKILQKGDLLKVDTGVVYKDGISDSAFSYVVGGKKENKKGYNLASTTKKALDDSLEYIQPGKSIYEFSKSIYKTMRNEDFEVLKKLTGHGVGVKVHEKPHIYNWPHQATKDIYFEKDMIICLEPITSIKSIEFKRKEGNDWNLYTEKGDLWAQWEYMVLINDDGYEILSWLQDL